MTVLGCRRFEVPFNIWCEKCGEHIAKGERFNAEKKAIGNYHSTKVLQFTMAHHCGCKMTIQTDPKNAEYLVIEGARRKVGRPPLRCGEVLARAWSWSWHGAHASNSMNATQQHYMLFMHALMQAQVMASCRQYEALLFLPL